MPTVRPHVYMAGEGVCGMCTWVGRVFVAWKATFSSICTCNKPATRMLRPGVCIFKCYRGVGHECKSLRNCSCVHESLLNFVEASTHFCIKW